MKTHGFAGSLYNDAGAQLDTKSNQWFGATVASAGIDGPIVVSKLAISSVKLSN